ncbi:MAG: hypothetical protein IJ017_05655 [Oscillospiraceae bacterium]|nr:hypothetical protein [Oscillospiraceae bacterium]
MKKFISLLIVAVLLVSCMATTALAAGATLTVSNETASAGETVTVSFSISEATFATYQVGLTYDSSVLTLKSIQQGAATQGLFSGGSKASAMNMADYTANGVLFTATFDVADTAPVGTYTVGAAVENFTMADAVTTLSVGVASGSVTVPEAPHVHDYTATVTEPTCEEKGYTTYTCSCGDSYKEDSVDALGHSYDKWVVTKAATCTEAGAETRTCSACGDVETAVIPAAGHSYTYTVNEDGTHTGVCSVCGDKVTAAHEYENNGYCVCGDLKAGTVTEKDEDLDDVPATGDITPMVTFGFVAVISMTAAAAYVLKRKTAK